MKKIFFITIFLSAISLILILPSKVSAEVGVNLTKNLVDSNGNILPELNLAGGFSVVTSTTASNRGYTYFVYDEERSYDFLVFYDKNDNLKVLLLADNGCYYYSNSCQKNYYNYKIDNTDKMYVYKLYTENNYYEFNTYTFRVQAQLNSKTASYTYQDSSSYNNPFLLFSFDGTNWNVSNAHNWSIKNIIYSTRDIYYATNPNDMSTLSLLQTGQEYVKVNLPDYMPNYKEVVLDDDTKFAFLSGLSKGRIYVPVQDFANYSGKLGYINLDLENMPYDSIIPDYGITSDGLYIYQDFDLSNYEGSSLVAFYKFIYLEDIDYDDFSYSIFVPQDMYVSKTKPVANEQGGNDFNFDYKDENGNIISSSFNTDSSSDDNTFFGTLTNSLAYFRSSVNYICSLFTDFFECLPSFVKNSLILCFCIGVLIIIVSFLF